MQRCVDWQIISINITQANKQLKLCLHLQQLATQREDNHWLVVEDIILYIILYYVCFTLIEAAPAHTQVKYKIHVNHGSPHALHLKSMPNAKYGISNSTSCFVQTFKNRVPTNFRTGWLSSKRKE